MPVTPQQVVPWAAAFAGGTAASWLAYKLAPKKYKDFLGALGLLGGGALSYFLANKTLVPALDTPRTDPLTIDTSTEQPQAPANSLKPTDIAAAEASPEAVPSDTPGFWAKAWAKAKGIAERSVSPVPKEIIPESYRKGALTGLQETYLDAAQETAENRLLSGKSAQQALSTAQWASLGGWAANKLPLGKLNKFIPGARYARGMGALTRTIDTAQVLANTVADAKKGLRDNYYGSKADEDNEVIDQTGWGIKDKFLFNLARQMVNKAIHTAGSLAIMKSPGGMGGLTQFSIAPHLPVGEVIGLGKELNTVGVDSKENRLQGKVLADALFNDIKAKPGETPGEAFLRGLKNTARGTAKLFSGGAFGSDIHNLKTEEEALAAKPIRGTAVAGLKQRLTENFLKTNPEVAKDYNSTDGVKRLRALQQINRAIAPRLNTRFSF